MKKQQQKNKTKLGALVAGFALFIGFAISVNTFPAVANNLSELPAIGKLVQVLNFNDNKAETGEITDGTDVKFISLDKKGNMENLVITFGREDSFTEVVNRSTIEYTEHPYTMYFTIPGARYFSAQEDLEAIINKSDLIIDVYRLMTLDDSMIRFAVTFKQPVQFEIREYKNPAQFVVEFKKDAKPTSGSVYSVRTLSHPYGEYIGVIEEMLFEVEKKRMLKDENGTYLVEAANFATEEEAKNFLEYLQHQYESEIEFYIEKRSFDNLPSAIY